MTETMALDFSTFLLLVLLGLAIVKFVQKYVLNPVGPLQSSISSMGVLRVNSSDANGVSLNASTTEDPLNEIPSPPAPKDNNLGHLPNLAEAGSLHQYLAQLHQQYGPIVRFQWAQTPVVSLAAPELLRDIIKLNDRPEIFFSIVKPFVGKNSIQFCNGPEAMERRRIIDPFFNPQSFSASASIINSAVDSTLKEWKERADKSNDGHWTVDVNILEETTKLQIKTVCLTAFGTDIFGDDEYTTLAEGYAFCWSELYARIKEGEPTEGSERLRLWNLNFSKFDACIETMLRHKINNQTNDKSLISEMLKSSIYKNNVDVLRDDVVSVLVGAFHTSANALTWALYFISKYSKVQKRIHEELDSVLNGAVDGDKQIDLLPRLTYLTSVLSETLRVSMLAPIAARYSSTDIVVGGFKIPANTPMIESLGTVLKDEKVWADSETFDPERFNTKSKDRHPLAFSPFGVGKRLCPAHQYAPIALKFVLSKLLLQCQFDLTSNKDLDIQPSFNLVSTPDRDLFLRVSSRQ